MWAQDRMAQVRRKPAAPERRWEEMRGEHTIQELKEPWRGAAARGCLSKRAGLTLTLALALTLTLTIAGGA